MSDIRKLERQLERAKTKLEKLERDYGSETHNFHGGRTLGYYESKVTTLEDCVDLIKRSRIESQRETYKRIMRMDLPAWLNKKLSSEVRRCEELLKELSNDE